MFRHFFQKQFVHKSECCRGTEPSLKRGLCSLVHEWEPSGRRQRRGMDVDGVMNVDGGMDVEGVMDLDV